MKIKFYKQDIKIKLFKIFVFATFLITFKNLSIMRNEVEKSKDLNFFQCEKALRNNPSSKLEIGNYFGEIDDSGRPKIDFENGRVKALFNSFAKVLEMEFGEKLDQKITKKLSPNPEKISIEKLIAKTTKGANEI